MNSNTNYISVLKYLSIINESIDSKIILESYINVAKTNPLLIVENDLYNSFKTSKFTNSTIASNYVFDKIKALNKYNNSDYKNLNESINKFIKEYSIETDNIEIIDSSISNMISESLSDNKNLEILYESISNVVDFMTNEDYNVKSKINKFNEKYKLKSDEISIVKSLSESINKKDLLESLKSETIDLIKNNSDSNIEQIINETIEKINGITFDDNTINESIIDLYELKKELLD